MSDNDYPPNLGQTPEEKAAEDAAKEMAEEERRAEQADDDAQNGPVELTEADIAAGAMDQMAPPDADALREEVTSLNDRILRLAAELENTRRRAEREKVDAGKYAITNFARDLLSVADNFERALAAAPDAEKVEATPETISGLLTGMRMTEKELIKTLERHGVARLDPKGEKFDPNIHQAVAQAPAAGVPSGHVAEVAQTGFVLGDRVLRAAMVVVSTGEPAGGNNSPPTDENPEDTEKGAHIDTSV